MPLPPQAFSATVLTVGGVPQVASMTWTPPPGDVTGYRLEAGTAFGLADITTMTLGTAASVEIAGVPRGEYYLRVRAVNAGGTGAPSPDQLLKIP